MSMEELAKLFEVVKVLPLRPTDVLVFKAKVPISHDTGEKIKRMVAETTGHLNVLVLPHNADIEVLRPEPVPSPWWKFWSR